MDFCFAELRYVPLFLGVLVCNICVFDRLCERCLLFSISDEVEQAFLTAALHYEKQRHFHLLSAFIFPQRKLHFDNFIIFRKDK